MPVIPTNLTFRHFQSGYHTNLCTPIDQIFHKTTLKNKPLAFL